MPISRRRPPLPLRTSSEPRLGRGRFAEGPTPPGRAGRRARAPRSGAQPKAMAVVARLAHHGDDLFHGRAGADARIRGEQKWGSPSWLIRRSPAGTESGGHVPSLRQATLSSSLFLFRPARPHCAPLLARGRVRPGGRADPAEAGAKLRPCHPKRHEKRGTEGPECLFDGDAADVREGHADHWKISVVQSPPWRRTSWARAGPSGRSWKSTKKCGSISIPPSGGQLTRISHERSPG
jgi:hypothetical protein